MKKVSLTHCRSGRCKRMKMATVYETEDNQIMIRCGQCKLQSTRPSILDAADAWVRKEYD